MRNWRPTSLWLRSERASTAPSLASDAIRDAPRPRAAALRSASRTSTHGRSRFARAMRPQASVLSSSDDPRDPTVLARANNGIVEIALHIARIDRRYIDHMFAEIGRPVSQYAGLSRVAPGVPAPSLLRGRRVLDKSNTYVGLDVHKDTIAVALAEAGARKDVREYGKVANTATALNALAAKLSRAGSELRFCYEAGPCGYGIQRQLRLAGHGCVVVAPSLIPRKPGDRIKTDRRDAINLAKLHRAGELTAVSIS